MVRNTSGQFCQVLCFPVLGVPSISSHWEVLIYYFVEYIFQPNFSLHIFTNSHESVFMVSLICLDLYGFLSFTQFFSHTSDYLDIFACASSNSENLSSALSICSIELIPSFWFCFSAVFFLYNGFLGLLNWLLGVFNSLSGNSSVSSPVCSEIRRVFRSFLAKASVTSFLQPVSLLLPLAIATDSSRFFLDSF